MHPARSQMAVEPMLAYPIDLTDDDGTLLVTAPDFPELTTFGDDRDEAIARAADALEEAIAARISRGDPIPAPSEGGARLLIPAHPPTPAGQHQSRWCADPPQTAQRARWAR